MRWSTVFQIALIGIVLFLAGVHTQPMQAIGPLQAPGPSPQPTSTIPARPTILPTTTPHPKNESQRDAPTATLAPTEELLATTAPTEVSQATVTTTHRRFW
jgi:hypothetical protein